jgi:tetratricopeptide (TPR) repeat protein
MSYPPAVPDPQIRNRPPWRGLFFLAILHTVLIVWAARAWIAGPFEGRGVIDGAEVLLLALEGSAGPFETKSPLYPAFLGLILDITGEIPWTVAFAGLVSSLALLLATGLLAFRLAGRRAAELAAGLYAVSGSTLAFSVQPLPTVFAAALLASGTLALIRGEDPSRRASPVVGGALLVAAVFARFSLLPAALLLIVFGARKQRSSLLGALGALALLGSVFGARVLPEGGGLNLRLANSAQRSGITDFRPGPSYHRLRWDAVESQSPTEPLTDLDREQYTLLGEELRSDPVGAAVTLLRKFQLFWHGTEIVASADFRHGLRAMPLAPLLLGSFALIAPLALVGLFRRRSRVLWLAIAGVLAANVLFATSARYRFPALPFCCAAAGCALAGPRSRREVGIFATALLFAAPNWSGARLIQAGDGLVQEAYLRLDSGSLSDGTVAVLEEAVRTGEDPRAAYLLGVCRDRRWQTEPSALELEGALTAYLEALRRESDYPEAAENLVAALLRSGRVAEARSVALRWLEVIPRAGLLHLNLAGILEEQGARREAREHAARGHQLMALRALSQNARDNANRHAREARALGVEDRRLP